MRASGLAPGKIQEKACKKLPFIPFPPTTMRRTTLHHVHHGALRPGLGVEEKAGNLTLFPSTPLVAERTTDGVSIGDGDRTSDGPPSGNRPWSVQRVSNSRTTPNQIAGSPLGAGRNLVGSPSMARGSSAPKEAVQQYTAPLSTLPQFVPHMLTRDMAENDAKYKAFETANPQDLHSASR
eukprot:gene28241-31344_t